MYVTHIGEFLYRVLYIYWYFLFIIFWYFSLFNQSKFWRRPRGYRVRDFVVFTHIKYLFYLLPPLVLSLSISFFVVYNTQQPNNQEDQIMVGFFIFSLSRIIWSVKYPSINQIPKHSKKERISFQLQSLFLLLTKMSMSSMSSPSSAVFSPENLSPDPLSPSEQLCYVQCNYCETILAVNK